MTLRGQPRPDSSPVEFCGGADDLCGGRAGQAHYPLRLAASVVVLRDTDRQAERIRDDAVRLIVLLGACEPDARQIVKSQQAADTVDEPENGRRAGMRKIVHPNEVAAARAVLTAVRT